MKTLLNGVVLTTAVLALGCQDLQATPPLALDQRHVKGLTTDGDQLYWTTGDGRVRRVSTAGGHVDELAAVDGPTHIVVDAAYAYVTSNVEDIVRVPKAGGAPEILVHGEDGLGDLQVDDGHVYWLTLGDTTKPGKLKKAKKAPGAAVTPIAEGSLDPNHLLFAGSLFFDDPGAQAGDAAGIREVGTSGGAPSLVFGGRFHVLATNGATICGAGIDPEAAMLDPNATTQAIVCAPFDGGASTITSSDGTMGGPVTVARDLGFVVSMAIDDATIYFATDDGQVSAIGLNGAAPGTAPTSVVTSSDGTTDSSGGTRVAPVVLASGPAGGASLALDLTSVYWVHENGNAIYTAPRF